MKSSPSKSRDKHGMRPGFTWLMLMAWRDSRRERGRLALFSLSLVIGIAAMAALHALRGDAERAMDGQEKALLGSDLQVSGRRAFSAEELAAFRGQALELAEETAFASMLRFFPRDATVESGARLVRVRGISGNYPFYGAVETEPPGMWQGLEGGILMEQALLDQFGVRVGDRVKLGEADLEIRGVLKRPPPGNGRFASFSPEVFTSLADVKRSGLLGTSSLAFHYLHLRTVDDTGALAIKEKYKNSEAGWRLETPADRRETLGGAIENFRQFLGLLAMASMVLGSIGVASAMHAHLERRVQAVAVLRCLGAGGNMAMGVYLVQAFFLGLAGALAGALLGALVHAGVSGWLKSQTGLEWSGGVPVVALLQAAGAGLGVSLTFALFPLLKVRHVSPARVLRAGNELSGGGVWGRLILGLLLVGAVFGLGCFNTGDPQRAAIFTGSLAGVMALLWGIARVLVWGMRRYLPKRWPYELRQGFSNLHRPGNQTVTVLLSLGLGAFLLMTVLFAREQIVRRTSVFFSKDSPGLYLVDVQADQIATVRAKLEELSLPVLEAAPMVTMRIVSAGGLSAAEMQAAGRVPKWILQREFRSSYRDTLNPTEKVVEGEWKPGPVTPGLPVPLSLEKDLAKDLGIGLGDPLVVNVQGVEIECVIASLREVDWSRFNLNFFMIFPSGVLESAPGFHVFTTRMPEGKSSGELQKQMAASLPNVSVIDLALILETVRGFADRILAVVGVLTAVALLSGALVLAGALWNGAGARRRECELLQMLGASRNQLRVILCTEYAVLGLLSGLAALPPALAADLALAWFVFKIDPAPPFLPVLWILAGCTLAAVLAGWLVSRGAAGKK